MAREFPLVPRTVPLVTTLHRKILTAFPVPESIPLLAELRTLEPHSMSGQPPVVWDRGDGYLLRDPWGNQWIDLSSGVLVAGMGYGNSAIVEAVQAQMRSGIYHSYCFATRTRLDLVRELHELVPRPLEKVFLLTTGSEATECAMKVARAYALMRGEAKRTRLITFDNGFHGRTLGAQLAGGSPGLKSWIPGDHPEFVQVPFPDGYLQPDVGFDRFLAALRERGIGPDKIYAVMAETYQGCNATMWSPDYAQAMRSWCSNHGIVLILDEIQAGFGRTGKMFGFQHLGIIPDLITCGKGISGGLPLAAVIGRAEIMDVFPPGSMTSTHSASPTSCAATLANIAELRRTNAIENASTLGSMLSTWCVKARSAASGRIGHTASVGLVAALMFVKPGSKEPDPDLAWEVVRRTVESGVMLFAPVGVGGGTVKINPPLMIDASAFAEALDVVLAAITDLCR